MKKISFMFLIILSVLISACNSNHPSQEEDTPKELIEMTLEELSAFDGKEGRNAYIAVDGYIYDVTGSSRWRNGEHNGLFAGRDLSDQIRTLSPHGLSVLNNVPKIGILILEGE